MIMIKNLVRTCDLCHREIPAGKYVQRNTEPGGMDLLLVLVENIDKDLELTENPDGTIGLDTCVNCYSRMGFNHSHTLN
jgi:hypothetical protein